MGLELNLALRYLVAKRSNQFIAFISVISVLGIALGATVLITVLSVMNGFEKEIRSRILGATSHATIQSYNGIDDWQNAVTVAKKEDEVTGAAPFVHGEGMATFQYRTKGILVRGILPDLENQVADFSGHMLLGKMQDLEAGQFRVVIGEEMAATLGVTLGDSLTLVTPDTSFSPLGTLPRMRRFQVVGIFRLGMFEYDSSLALIHIDDAKKLYRKTKVDGIHLRLDDMIAAPVIAKRLEANFDGLYQVSDWSSEHVNYFKAVKTEKRVMFILLLLVVAIAVFNVISTMVMIVSEKESDIAILRTLGAKPSSITTAFLILGTMIGGIGVVLGVIGGVSLSLNIDTIATWIEQTFHIQFFPADVYYISEMPSDLRQDDVIKVGLISFALTVLATLYPAFKATHIQPAEVLRND